MIWREVSRADASARVIADRHYNRQAVGSAQFVPPGRCLVLHTATETGRAFWVTSWPFAEYVKHEWAGAWMCSAFRNEGAGLSSTLIRAAVAATRWRWPSIPELGMVTFVDPEEVRHKRDPGRCFLRAGFEPCGMTKGGLLAFQLHPAVPKPLLNLNRYYWNIFIDGLCTSAQKCATACTMRFSALKIGSVSAQPG